MEFKLRHIIPFVPILGICIYLVFYFIAIQSYPGGSENDLSTIGYNHFHNFLCDANHQITSSGLINDGRTLAIIGHVFLTIGMVCFFYILPEIFNYENKNTRWVKKVGMFTFACFVLMFTKYHDYIVFTTGVFGTIALIPYFIELKHFDKKLFIQLSWFCFLIGVGVFFMYFSKLGYFYLPFIEKIAFVFYSIWVFWVSFIVADNRKKKLSISRINI